jgi:putative glycosyltransferase (TIGR04348 family)
LDIAIVMPPGVVPRGGNKHTALRWAGFLRAGGHRVSLSEAWGGGGADLLLALHARRSHASVVRFHEAHPDRPLVVVLTGTDLYRDLREHAEARKSLELATRLVVLQTAGVRELPARMRPKTQVVFQSSATRLRHAPVKARFRVAVLGHLREEKDPFRTVLALGHLPADARIEVVQLGAVLSPGMAGEAKEWMQREPRYRWLDSRPHAQALRWLASSHLLVVSSVMEGGANVICEAARIGVPVLASRVSGNVGMLGTDYPGYFPLHDEKRLARLIARAAADKSFYEKLKRAIAARRALFSPAAERKGLLDLVRQLP